MCVYTEYIEYMCVRSRYTVYAYIVPLYQTLIFKYIYWVG